MMAVDGRYSQGQVGVMLVSSTEMYTVMKPHMRVGGCPFSDINVLMAMRLENATVHRLNKHWSWYMCMCVCVCLACTTPVMTCIGAKDSIRRVCVCVCVCVCMYVWVWMAG